MRILISTRRGAGHFGPLIPFAKAFLRNNDDVVIVAAQSAAAMVAASGLDHIAYPDPPDDERDAVFAEARRMSFDDANERVLREIFIGIDTRHAYPHVLAAMRSWRPDAVLYDISEFAAPLAAETLGVPAVCVGITAGSNFAGLAPTMAHALDAVRAEIGLRPDPDLDMLNCAPYFTLTPAELEDPADPSPAQAMRFREEDDAARPLPDWWTGVDWPLVYLTFGSVAPTMDFFPGLYREALDALALLPGPRARDRGPRARPARARAGGPERARRPLGAAGGRHAARGGDGLPRRLGHDPLRAHLRRAGGRRAAVRRPALQRRPGRRPGRRHRPQGHDRARGRRPADSGRPVVPRGGAADRRRQRAAADRRPRGPAIVRDLVERGARPLRASRARWRAARPGRGRPRPACRRCCAGACAPCSWRARARGRSACRPCPGRGA